MNEKLFFLNRPSHIGHRKIFVHSFQSEVSDRICFLFLNGFLDRMGDNIIRALQVDMARLLAKNGNAVFHFDYYGTGDSHGDSYELDIEDTLEDIAFIVDYIKQQFQPLKIILFGVRLGADIALRMLELRSDLENTIIVEPVVNGKYFYKSRLFLMKSAHIMYDVKSVFHIKIYDKPYEDFDGFPMSEQLKSSILTLSDKKCQCQNKNILFYSLNNPKNTELDLDILTEEKYKLKLKKHLAEHNRVKFLSIPIDVDRVKKPLVNYMVSDVLRFIKLLQHMS